MPSDRETKNTAYHATNEANILQFNNVRRRRRTEKNEYENPESVVDLYHGHEFDDSTIAAGVELERYDSDPPSEVDEIEEEEKDWYTDESETDEEVVAFEQRLHHSSFYETPKNRRRRHVQNRNKGKIPRLHFAGSHKTDFWQRYGITPDQIMEPGSLKGIQAIFSEVEFNELGSTERRIHVNGQKFKIVSNEELQGNLYTAIAQAIGKPNERAEAIQQRIYDELDRRKAMFVDDIFKYCDNYTIYMDDSLSQNHRRVIEKYKQHRRLNSNTPPELELIAAAVHYGFTYSIVEVTSTDKAIVVRNCKDIIVRQRATNFSFLSGIIHATEITLHAVEIGPLVKIEDGQYPTLIREVILVEKIRRKPRDTSPEERKPYRPKVGPITIGFALDHRIFLHRSTVAHDLWSLLAELIFKKLVYAPQIKQKILDSKHNFAVYYLASKAKKRFQVHGNASIQTVADEFNRRFLFEHPRGDLEDLAQAASVYNFSYTVIGMDSNGNFFWRDYEAKHEANKSSAPYLAFFVKTMMDRTMFWFALEDQGRDCPKERKLYRHVRAGDLSVWKGNFYFRYTPEKTADEPEKLQSTRELLSPSTRLLRDAANWSSNNVERLRSSIAGVASAASLMTRNVAQSMFNIVKWIKTRRRVEPEKAIQSLFARDQP
ncbi:hypothetical protein Ocin01_10505 [Orchesella cincta]|uniref:Uncharacterized protein n=1 Tax=Orchesella cincta TaxID=48709 RepID=A0A1D2MSU6_ORCCI|nr:hypothetical protein Ocin01_10505 [Orchesella cincta]